LASTWKGSNLKTLTCDRAVDHSSGLANRSRISGLPPTGENQIASVGAADTVEIPPGTDAHPSNVSTEAINILDELTASSVNKEGRQPGLKNPCGRRPRKFRQA
jgi:hypothetical protein